MATALKQLFHIIQDAQNWVSIILGQSQVIFQRVCREKQKRYIWSIKSLQTLPFSFLLCRSAKPVSPAPSSGLSLSKIENWTFFCQKIPFQNRKHCTCWKSSSCWLRGIYELIICFEMFHHELKWIWSNSKLCPTCGVPKTKIVTYHQQQLFSSIQ